jgi:SulP family sulfate permease
VISGARSRWASIFAGIWMAAVVVALSGLVARVAMPALGGTALATAVRTSARAPELEKVTGAGSLPYESAATLAARGLPADEIAARCGLAAGEARLLASLAQARASARAS